MTTTNREPTSIRIDRSVSMPMRDGTVLRGDVWRPDDDRARPSVLVRTPYDRRATKSELLPPMHCVRSEFAFVIQDTRGRFESGGEWNPADLGTEGQDTHDTVEWIAAQPWCDGTVFMTGASYLGIVQLLGAAERPPHLAAIAPAMTTSAELDQEIHAGALRLNEVLTWLAFQSLDWATRHAAADDPTVVRRLWELVLDPEAVLRRNRPYRTHALPAFDVPGLPFGLADVLGDGAPGVAKAFRYEDIAVPSLSITGWYDSNCWSTIESFRRLRSGGGGSNATRSAHRLLVGPWAHSTSLTDHLGEVSFTAQADPSVAGLAAEQVAFFREHAAGSATGSSTSSAMPVVRYFLMGADQWRTADQWPPAESSPRTWYLDSGGHAATEGGFLRREPPAAERPADYYAYDPDDPVPSRGGRVVTLGRMVPGPLDRSHLERRTDVACYTSDPLEADLDAVGGVEVTVYAETTALDTDFVARLLDVCPDGRALSVAEGIQRAGSRAAGRPEPHTVVDYSIRLGYTAWRFPRGHRLRLEVSSSDFPAYDPNPNTGEPLGAETEGVVAHQTIHHDARRPSRITIDVDHGPKGA